MLQPHKGLRVSDSDRRRLVGIHRRMECLIGPLNFCVMWSQDKDSCISPVIQQAYELVQNVTDFLDKVKFTADELDPFTRILDKDSSVKVDYFLRELEFACASITMAVSISREFSHCQSNYISPSALLKASRRVSEMSCRSGDLFAVKGALYRKDDPWVLVSTDCVLKVALLKSIDPKDSPYIIRVSCDECSLNLPIETALSFRLVTNRVLGISLGSIVDSPMISWRVVEQPVGKRILHRNPSGEPAHLDSSDDESVVVHGPAEVPPSLRPGISSTRMSVCASAADYAFHTTAAGNMLELVYMAKLCVMEASSPFIEASDEALFSLLGAQPQPDVQLVVNEVI